jgi:hypothetical protein
MTYVRTLVDTFRGLRLHGRSILVFGLRTVDADAGQAAHRAGRVYTPG